MVVGEIDVRTGTRDINELSGLRRSMPITFVVAVISAASMAGIPPLLGFPTKEAAVEAALGLVGKRVPRRRRAHRRRIGADRGLHHPVR